MGGEVLIEYFAYLVKRAVRSIRLRGKIRWTATPANVYYVKASGGGVDTVYSYKFDGGYYSGRDSRDFYWGNSAKDYVSRFPTGTAVTIRVNPAKPEEMAFLDDDQGL